MQSGDVDSSGSAPGGARAFEVVVTVVEAVTAELEKLPDDLGTSGLAAVVLAMAERIDDPNTRPTAAAMCAQRLQDALTQLHRVAPAKPKKDKLDELSKRRDRRRTAS